MIFDFGDNPAMDVIRMLLHYVSTRFFHNIGFTRAPANIWDGELWKMVNEFYLLTIAVKLRYLQGFWIRLYMHHAEPAICRYSTKSQFWKLLQNSQVNTFGIARAWQLLVEVLKPELAAVFRFENGSCCGSFPMNFAKFFRSIGL